MRALRALALASALTISMPAFAQGIPVYDSSPFLQTLSTVKNTLSMIEQGKEQIAQAITVQYGFPYLPLSNYDTDENAIKLVPENVARQYCLIPIDKIGNNLTVAMSNPLNTQAIEDVEMISKCVVQAFVSTTSDIRRAVEKCYAKK